MDQYIEQLNAEMFPEEPLLDVVQNIMDELLSQQVKIKLLKPLLPQRYAPKTPPRKRKERKRKAMLEGFDPIQPQQPSGDGLPE